MCSTPCNNKQTRKCPLCRNYFELSVDKDGVSKGVCSVCKSVVSIKQTSPKETTIKIKVYC